MSPAALAAAAVALLAAAAPARANPYEAFIDIETEEDLHDLLASQQIEQETFDALIDLLYRGVDLNTADRDRLYSLPNLTYDDVDAILAYRAEQGFIRDPADLVGAGALTPEKLLAIAPFLVVRDPFARRAAVRGLVQTQARFTIGDDRAPPVAIRARTLVGREITTGLVVTLTRLRAGDVVYDPNREALLADPPATRAHVAKAYVAYEDDELQAIAGTYRIGFGQRLTFDNSSTYAPNGIYRDDQIFRSYALARACRLSTGELGASPCSGDYHYVTPDFAWREGLLGVAAGVRRLRLGDGWLQLYAWASAQPRSIYQYELYDAARCADPRDDDDPACAAPDVFRRPDGDRLTPSPKLAYTTLPSMFLEPLAGANATYFLTRRNRIGVTAYGAKPTWLVDDGVDGGPGDRLRLDFQEWASRPSGGSYGAVGMDATIGIRSFDVGAELAHSFDAMRDVSGPARGGGGPAAIVRATYTDKGKQEVEVVGRYYGVDFVNPYGRPIAAPDELEGQRARDEAGARVRYTGRFGGVGVRTSVDVWTNPAQPSSVPKAAAYLRADVRASKAIRWGVWIDAADRDLTGGGRGQCYDQPFERDELGEPVDCRGMRLSTSARVRWQVDRDVALSAQIQQRLLDAPQYTDAFRRDLSGWLSATWRATPDLRVRARVRYLNEDVAAPTRLEQSIWAYLEGSLRLRARDRLRLRADWFQYLDERDRTLQRTPSPELWLWAQYEARY